MSVSLGWTGSSGYATANGFNELLRVKPALTFGFDVLLYHSEDSRLSAKLVGGIQYGLSAEEKEECRLFAEAATSDSGSGGLSTGLTPDQLAWFDSRKDDPRLLPEAAVWLTEREDDPPFSPELKAWLVERGDDPRFTAALANWLAERQDDPRFTSARSSQVDTLRSDVNALAGRMHTVETAPIDAVRVPLKTLVMLTSPLQPAQVRLLNYIAFRGSSNGQIALPIVLPASTDQATLDAQEAVRVGHELTISNASASRTLTVSKGNSTFWSFDWATIGTTTTLKANEVIQLIAVRDVATNTNGWHMSMRTLNRIN